MVKTALPSLALKQPCKCITVPTRMLKRRYQVFSAHIQACTSFTGPPQWGKLLSRSSLALNQASMCFTAPPSRLKRWYQAFPAHKQPCTKLTGPVESPPYRKSIRGHTTLFSAHSQTRALNITFDPSPRRPKNRYILGYARTILMQLISGLCGK